MYGRVIFNWITQYLLFRNVFHYIFSYFSTCLLLCNKLSKLSGLKQYFYFARDFVAHGPTTFQEIGKWAPPLGGELQGHPAEGQVGWKIFLYLSLENTVLHILLKILLHNCDGSCNITEQYLFLNVSSLMNFRFANFRNNIINTSMIKFLYLKTLPVIFIRMQYWRWNY